MKMIIPCSRVSTMTSRVSTMTNSVVTFFLLLLLLAFSNTADGFLRPTPFAPKNHLSVRWAVDSEADALLEKAAALRREAEALEADDALPAEAGQIGGTTKQQATAAAEQRALRRLKMNLPISKPDFSVVDEDVEFAPALPLGTSELLKLTAPLPLGIILEEGGEQEGKEDHDDGGNDGTSSGSPVGRGFTWVAEVGGGSNGEAAGVRPGDVLRACTAVKVQMEMPTWQLLGGGIGRPRPFRFIYSVDQRPFEEVMDAVGSNRLDPEARDVTLVVERPSAPPPPPE